MIPILFNNIDLEPYFRIKEIRGRGLIKRKINSITVPGMDGEYVESIDTPSKVLEVDIRITSSDLRKTIDTLNSILATDEPVPIVFPDEPEMTYYGTVETSEETGERVHLGRHDSTIYIRQSDPYKYGPEQREEIKTDVHSVRNDGTAEAKPIIELTVKEPITFAMVQNNNDLIKIGNEFYPKYMMLGKSIDVENQAPFVKYERVFHSVGNSLVGWSPHDSVDGGSVAGQMETNGTRFQAANYGTGTSWHGPAIKRGLTEPLQDFRLETTIGFWNGQPQQVGRVEIYLLDINGNQVAKVAMKDTKSGRSLAMGEVRAGDASNNHYLISGPASHDDGWNNFYGVLRVEREGNIWKAYIGKINQNTGEHHWRRAVEWPDNEGKFTRTIAQVVVHVGRVGTHTSGAMGVYDVSVYKINKQQDGVPYIAGAGDKIIFDSTTGDAFINGEPRNELLDFGSDFINLVKGNNLLVVHPSGFDKVLKYRKRYR